MFVIFPCEMSHAQTCNFVLEMDMEFMTDEKYVQTSSKFQSLNLLKSMILICFKGKLCKVCWSVGLLATLTDNVELRNLRPNPTVYFNHCYFISQL